MMIDDLALARPIHVLALAHWIGGVAVVRTIVLPHVRALPNAKDAVASFEAFELRFASQARISIPLVGLSGAYILTKLGAWNRTHMLDGRAEENSRGARVVDEGTSERGPRQ